MNLARFLSLFLPLLWTLYSCSPAVDTSDDLPIGARYDAHKSLEYLSKIIEHDPENDEVRFQRARIYLEFSAPLKAKDDIQAALSEKPDDVDYLLLKAKIDMQLGQMEDALAAVDKIQQMGLKVQTVDYLLFASQINLVVGNFNKAGSFLRQATEYAPEYSKLLSQRARYYAYTHDTVKAFAFYKMAFLKDSTLEEVKMGLAELYLRTHAVDTSILYLKKLKPIQDVQYNSLVAKTLLLTNQGDSASKHLYIILHLSPYHPEANYDLALYYMAKGDMASGLNFLQRIPENDRDTFKDYYYKLAVAYQSIGNEELAKEYFNKQYSIDSTYLNKAKKRQKESPVRHVTKVDSTATP